MHAGEAGPCLRAGSRVHSTHVRAATWPYSHCRNLASRYAMRTTSCPKRSSGWNPLSLALLVLLAGVAARGAACPGRAAERGPARCEDARREQGPPAAGVPAGGQGGLDVRAGQAPVRDRRRAAGSGVAARIAAASQPAGAVAAATQAAGSQAAASRPGGPARRQSRGLEDADGPADLRAGDFSLRAILKPWLDRPVDKDPSPGRQRPALPADGRRGGGRAGDRAVAGSADGGHRLGVLQQRLGVCAGV